MRRKVALIWLLLVGTSLLAKAIFQAIFSPDVPTPSLAAKDAGYMQKNAPEHSAGASEVQRCG